MTVARKQLLYPLIREELDCIKADPWDEHISGLYNDVLFRPKVMRNLTGEVKRSEIFRNGRHERTHG